MFQKKPHVLELKTINMLTYNESLFWRYLLFVVVVVFFGVHIVVVVVFFDVHIVVVVFL